MLEEELKEIQILHKNLKRFQKTCADKGFNCYFDHLEYPLKEAQEELEFRIEELKEEIKEIYQDNSQ